MTDNAAPTTRQLQDAYTLAKERYAALGVDTDRALATLGRISVSLHCWQGDDVAGFENPDVALSCSASARRATRSARTSSTWATPPAATTCCCASEVQAILHEIVAGGNLDRVHIGLDFFDASINRIAAWAIGMQFLDEVRAYEAEELSRRL